MLQTLPADVFEIVAQWLQTQHIARLRLVDTLLRSMASALKIDVRLDANVLLQNLGRLRPAHAVSTRAHSCTQHMQLIRQAFPHCRINVCMSTKHLNRLEYSRHGPTRAAIHLQDLSGIDHFWFEGVQIAHIDVGCGMPRSMSFVKCHLPQNLELPRLSSLSISECSFAHAAHGAQGGDDIVVRVPDAHEIEWFGYTRKPPRGQDVLHDAASLVLSADKLKEIKLSSKLTVQSWGPRPDKLFFYRQVLVPVLFWLKADAKNLALVDLSNTDVTDVAFLNNVAEVVLCKCQKLQNLNSLVGVRRLRADYATFADDLAPLKDLELLSVAYHDTALDVGNMHKLVTLNVKGCTLVQRCCCRAALWQLREGHFGDGAYTANALGPSMRTATVPLSFCAVLRGDMRNLKTLVMHGAKQLVDIGQLRGARHLAEVDFTGCIRLSDVSAAAHAQTVVFRHCRRLCDVACLAAGPTTPRIIDVSYTAVRDVSALQKASVIDVTSTKVQCVPLGVRIETKDTELMRRTLRRYAAAHRAAQ